MSSHLDEQQLELLRQRLLKRGVEINRKLADVLSGDTIDVERVIGRAVAPRPPDQDDEDRLRGFLGLIGRKIRATQNGSYGHCDNCGAAIPFAELERAPWATRCSQCKDRS